MKNYLKLIRIKQWIKNSFVLAPLFFSYTFFDINLVIQSIIAVFAFCFMSSTVYIINDISDRFVDKLHPKKKYRPIASGKISISKAVIIAIFLFIISLFLALKSNTILIVLIYLFINILYTKVLKKIMFIDIGIIAIGFFLRLLAGATAIDQKLSSWIILTTLFLSLLLGFSKRRSELNLSTKHHRETLKYYTKELLNHLIILSSTLTIITYSLYLIETKGVFEIIYLLNLPFMLYALFRYLYLVFNSNEGGDTAETIFSDKPLLLSILIWGIVIILTF